MTFRTGADADVLVTDAESDEAVWQWSDGRLFTQAIREETLDPGDAIEFACTWQEPVPGEYVAVATLAADVDVEARASFSV